jgi:hypothetical protein
MTPLVALLTATRTAFAGSSRAAEVFLGFLCPGRTSVQQRTIRQELGAAAADWWDTCCREQAVLPHEQRDSPEAFKARTAVVAWLRERARAR